MSRARKQDRFTSTLAVSYREPTSSEPTLGTCSDISPSGMFIETPRPAARGVLVRFECVGQGGQGVVRGTARVMWLRPHNEAQGKAGMGVRFVRLEPGSARVIEELIADASNAGARTRSDGPEARSNSEEPAVVLTAERTIGPINRSSSVPPKGLRAPTLRGMHPTDVRSSNPPPPSTERKSFDSGPPREAVVFGPAPSTRAVPSELTETKPDEPDRRSSRPPTDRANAHAQALRDRLDRAKRADETPTSSPPISVRQGPAAERGDDRITAPDGSAIDPLRQKEPTRNKGLGTTMHDASGAQAIKLSAGAGARRGSDTTLGVPSPPPPPWKARHSERPPGPGGVEVIRAVHVATDGQQTRAAAAATVPEDSTRFQTGEQGPEAVAPGSELPGADDPPASDWEPTITPSRPAIRPDRMPPHVSVPYALPPSADELEQAERGRNWLPWIIIGTGLLATGILMASFGRPMAGVPMNEAAAGSEGTTAASSPLAPENQFLPKTESTEPKNVPPEQVIVQLHDVEPLGAKVSALGQTAKSPGRMTFPFEMIQWPLRVRVEKDGFGATEVALPRRVFAADGDAIVHELYVALQPVAAAPQQSPSKPAPQPSNEPKDDSRRKPAAAKEPRAAKEPTDSKDTREPARSVATGEAPTQVAAAEPAESAKPEAPSGGTAYDRALECLSRGDNACVVSALGASRGQRELDLLIETYRATGDASSAEAAMRRYLELHPDGRRASQYRRALGVVTP